MRISKEKNQRLSELITKRLVDSKLILLKAQRESLTKRICETINDELKKEESLDKEVRALMEKNKALMQKDSIDYERMFNLIKTKLAKEKGIIL